MANTNQTQIRIFILLGLSNLPHLQVIFSLLFFLMYMVNLSGNFILIFMVKLNYKLQTPMYIFLCNLSIVDIGFSSTVVPKILANTLSRDRSISFLGCATQVFFHLALGGTECLLLTVMAYDRYIAICTPLRYNAVMGKKHCLGLSAGCWVASFLNAFMLTYLTFQLPFCKSNRISHFFCEMPPLFHIACQDTWFNEVVKYISAGLVVLGSFLLIVASYFLITMTILKISSSRERQKAFSTCVSHLIVVSFYYDTIMLMHLRPRSANYPKMDRVLTIFYTVVTPVLNPIIYSIRNKDVKAAIKKAMFVTKY
ncbi:olfactory receptor 5AR1-like [Gastrophryne carolinensis]